jgi:hypothetical protein
MNSPFTNVYILPSALYLWLPRCLQEQYRQTKQRRIHKKRVEIKVKHQSKAWQTVGSRKNLAIILEAAAAAAAAAAASL